MDPIEIGKYFNDYLVKVKLILLYDPTFYPHHMRKPEEHDIQDAKLIYYFPENANIHEKRNHVGMAEGAYSFWQALDQDYSSHQSDFDENTMKDAQQQKKLEEQQQQYQYQEHISLDKQEGVQKVSLQNAKVLLQNTSSSFQKKKQEEVSEHSILEQQQQQECNSTQNLDTKQQTNDDKDENQNNNLMDFSPQDNKQIINQEDLIDVDLNKKQAKLMESGSEKQLSQENLEENFEETFQQQQQNQKERLNLIDEHMVLGNNKDNEQPLQLQQQQSQQSDLYDMGFSSLQNQNVEKNQQEQNDLNQNKQEQKEEETQQQQQEEETEQETEKVFILEENKKFQVTFLDRYIHVSREIEENLWIYMVLQKQNPEIKSMKSYEYDYYDEDTNKHEYSIISEQSILQLCNHFYTTFYTFYGNIRPYLENQDGKQKFNTIFGEYIRRYQILNAHDHQHLNTLNYLYEGVRYSPIDKGLFLTIQYLLNILKSIDPHIKHFSVMYHGYFIYSSFPHQEALKLYDYYFQSGSPLDIDESKINKKFALLSSMQEKDKYNYGYFFNSLQFGTPKDFKSEAHMPKEDITVCLQNVYLNLNKSWIKAKKASNYNQKWQMNSFYDEGIMISMFYEAEQKVSLKNIIELNGAMLKNTERISQKLENSIQISLDIEQQFRFLYYNKVNLASKISNSFAFLDLLQGQSQSIRQVYEELKQPDVEQSVVKLSNSWIYGVKSMERIIIMLLPPALPLSKLQDEIDKLCKSHLSNLFI